MILTKNYEELISQNRTNLLKKLLESSKSGKMKKKKKNNNYSIKCDNGPRLKAVGVVNYSFSHSGTEFFMSSLSIL